MYKKGDIIKMEDPYGPAGSTFYKHYLILDTRQHYVYNVLCVETGNADIMNKNYVRKHAEFVA